MRIYFFLFAFLALLVASGTANASPLKQNSDIFKNIVVIKTKEKQKLASSQSFENEELNQLLKKINVVSIIQKFSFFLSSNQFEDDEFGLCRIFEIRYKDNISPIKLSKLLSESNLIEYSDPIFRPIPQSIPNDSLYSKQDFLEEIFAEKSWEITKGDSNIFIAIIDTEIDNLHEDLTNNIWCNPGECGLDAQGNDKRFNGIDDDGNGKIDDWRGWDFCSDISFEEYEQGIIREDNNTRLEAEDSYFFHGTSVAGAASAKTNNKIGISSIGYHTKILPVKVQSDLGAGWRASEGILYSAMLGADIINCSWLGLGRTNFEFDAIRQAKKMGCLIVAAAGNSASCINDDDIYIRNSKYVLYVGASDGRGPADFSNYGVPISTYLPSVSILTTYPNNRYEVASGSSLSAPICSAIAALVKSIHKDWSPEQIRHQIRSSTAPFNQNDLERKDFFGKANSYAALKHNRADFKDQPISGIECTRFINEEKTDSLKNYSETSFIFTFKNFLADANNIEISFESPNSLIEMKENRFFLNQILNLEECNLELYLKASDKLKWFEKRANLLITIKSNDYINYQIISIPLALKSKAEFHTQLNKPGLQSFFDYKFDYKEIKSISPVAINFLWGAGFSENNAPFFFLANEEKLMICDKIKDAETDYFEITVEGISENSALIYLKRKDKSHSLLLTQNRGGTWQKIKLNSTSLWNISKIHFFNEKNGIILANSYFSPFYQIFLTDDGGQNWKETKPELQFEANEFLQTETAFSQYESAFISTNKSRILHLSDFGHNWNFAGDEQNFSISNFYMSGENIFAYCSDSISSFFAISKNLGTTWEYFFNKSFFEYFDFPIFISGSNRGNSFLLVNEFGNFLIAENDFTFSQLKFDRAIIKNELLNQNLIKIAQSGNKSRLWFVCDSIYFFDLDNIFNPIDSSEKDDFIDFFAYPNPLYGNSAYFQIYLLEEKSIKLELFNSFGRRVKTLFNETAPANQYFTIQWNSSSLPSGVYFHRLSANGKIYTIPIVIAK